MVLDRQIKQSRSVPWKDRTIKISRLKMSWSWPQNWNGNTESILSDRPFGLCDTQTHFYLDGPVAGFGGPEVGFGGGDVGFEGAGGLDGAGGLEGFTPACM